MGYCINLGKFTDSEGNNYDLGVCTNTHGVGPEEVCSAIVYDNQPGSYMSGELIRNGRDAIMFENEMTIETLKRYKLYLKNNS